MQFDQIRRRIVLAVILLAAAIAAVRLVLVARDFDTVVTAANFEAARDDRTALRAFLQRMPKGGDLHTHLVGAVYAERFIAWAAQQGLCVDPSNVLLAKSECGRSPGAVPVAQALRDQTLYDRLVNAFSVRGFLPSPAGADGARRILRDVQPVRCSDWRAFRRHDGRPAAAI